jgi:peptide/nickel transport system permease protein
VLPFIFRRFLNLIPVFIGATILAFLIVQAAPGDFLDTRRLDTRTKPETIERLERKFGLDKSVPVQYVLWLRNVVTGDLGTSFDYDRPVLEVIGPRIGNSLILVIGNIILLYALAIPIGVYGAVRQYSLGDKTISVFSYFFLGFPSFFLALIAIYGLLQFKFATGGFLFPVSNMRSDNYDNLSVLGQIGDIAWHAVAPIVVLTVREVASFSRFMRAQMLEFLSQDYIRTARSKGLAERTVIYKHTLRNAVTPFIAGIGGILPALLSGAGFIEVVFNWPGLTPIFLDALNSQDVYIIVGTTAISLVLLIVGNLLSDLLLAAVDPRVRYS